CRYRDNLSTLSYAFTFLFFSSRRRHTRFSRDWSSDVCSSDLDPGEPAGEPEEVEMSTNDWILLVIAVVVALVVVAVLVWTFRNRRAERRRAEAERLRRSVEIGRAAGRERGEDWTGDLG